MGLYPGSTNSPTPATIYGPLPDHGRTQVSLVLHTTETTGTPGFNGGAAAPHYLYYPKTRSWMMWAEYEDGWVGTLRGHSEGGHGNCQAFQVEIVSYSDRNIADAHPDRLWVGDFTDEHYSDLADFYAWSMDRYGIGADVTPTPVGGWLYGTGSPHRLSPAAWDALSGVTAHGAVPLNSHWDTGVLDLQRIHDLALGDYVDYELIRQIVREEVEAALGGKPIVMPDGSRTGNQGIVNSVLWAETHGSTMWEQLYKASECGGQ